MNAIDLTKYVFPLLLLGCGSDDGIGLDGLQGSYNITSAIDGESVLWEAETPTCLLKVSGSSVSASCTKTHEDLRESLEIDAIVQETSISGELIYTSDSFAEPDCYVSISQTSTLSLSASKDSGSMVDGVFTPIAGNWSGNLTIEKSYEHVLIPDAPDYCSRDIKLFAYSFDATVAGSTAQINWQGEGESGVLDVVGTDNAISVNGDVVAK